MFLLEFIEKTSDNLLETNMSHKFRLVDSINTARRPSSATTNATIVCLPPKGIDAPRNRRIPRCRCPTISCKFPHEYGAPPVPFGIGRFGFNVKQHRTTQPGSRCTHAGLRATVFSTGDDSDTPFHVQVQIRLVCLCLPVIAWRRLEI